MFTLSSSLLPQGCSVREASEVEDVKKDITKVCEYMSACSEEHVTYRPYVNDVTCYISGCYVISCGHLEWQRAMVNCTV